MADEKTIDLSSFDDVDSFKIPNPLKIPGKAVHAIEHAVDEGVNKINDATNGGLGKIENDVKSGLGKVTSAVVNEGQKALQTIEKEAETAAEAAVQSVIGELAAVEVDKLLERVVTRFDGIFRAVENNPKLRKAANATSFHVVLDLGVVEIGCYWMNCIDRWEEIRTALKRHRSIAKTRSSIIGFVKDVVPDHVDAYIAGEVSLGVQLGGKVGIWYAPIDLFEPVFHDWAEGIGIPE